MMEPCTVTEAMVGSSNTQKVWRRSCTMASSVSLFTWQKPNCETHTRQAPESQYCEKRLTNSPTISRSYLYITTHFRIIARSTIAITPIPHSLPKSALLLSM